MSDFLCKRCADCCRTFRLPVKNKEELIKSFIKNFSFKLKSYEFEVVVRGECEYLENNKCSAYRNRPQRCKDFFCKKYPAVDAPKGQLLKKRCLICGNLRKFLAGTERDRQSVCGNCWVW